MTRLEEIQMDTWKAHSERLEAKLAVAVEALDGCINELESRGRNCLALIFAKNAVNYIVHGTKKD